MANTINFTVNGKKCQVDNSFPRDMSLNAYIRYELALPGTKAMCYEGGCGSCIVMVRAKRYPSEKVEIFAVNSCLVLVFSCHGWEITTIEGIGNRKHGYSEVQKRIVAFNGLQCGYCTPGWIMQITSLKDKSLTAAELEKSFGSNTCRCTAFRPILDTIQTFAVDAPPELRHMVTEIEELGICDKDKDGSCGRKCSLSSDSSDWSIIQETKLRTPIRLEFGKYKFFKVFYENEIFDILNQHGVDSYMFADGNTGKGLVETFEYPKNIIDVSEVSSLKKYYFDQNLVLGANISIEDAINIFKDTSKTKSEFGYLAEFAKHLELIAHIPVRKIGSLAGNLMYKHKLPTYTSDLFVLFECVGAYLTVRNRNGKTTTMSMKDFLKYNMQGVLMLNVMLPPFSNTHIFRSYKIMPRNQNALAIVNVAFLIKLGSNNEVQFVSIVYGNISPNFIHAAKTEAYLVGKKIFNDKVLQQAINVLSSEVIPAEIDGEPSVECRKTLALGLFYKFILNISPTTILSKYVSGRELMKRTVSKGKQDYQSDPYLYPWNKPESRIEGMIQAAGEARFANDLPPQPREVFGAFVLSSVYRGEVENINIEEILGIDGVIALYTPEDIPGVNSFTVPGIPLQTVNEEILATKIKYYGQPVAIVVAVTEQLAANVAKKVKVTYKNVSSEPPVLTIDAAKKDKSRYVEGGADATIEPSTERGTDVKKVIKGFCELEAQYHYYLEPITCVVVPVDNNLEVYLSTQWMDAAQIAIARSLGIRESEVIIKVSHVGGAFGGKMTRSTQCATACALVAKKLDVTCRFILPIQTNMATAGLRLPAQIEYEVGVDENGKIQYLDATIIEDKGHAENDSVLIFTAAAFANCYNRETWLLKTANVHTDLSTNTFARAPGSCEAITFIEHIMEHIAFTIGKDPTEVRMINMRTEDNAIPEMINTIKKDADYINRLTAVKHFNKTNRWMKKSISLSVMNFPIKFFSNFSALVSIYRGDGTVTITTGGIEMGQGINTKAAQACAYMLGIPLEYVNVISSLSYTAANNMLTGGSITTQSVCFSIIKCCECLNKRLEPIKERIPNASWVDIIKKAGEEMIDLSAMYMMTPNEPALKDYNAFAVAIIETQLDILTGRFEIIRSDILEDVGLSANPKLDVGQIQGGYLQAIGYYTCERIKYDKKTGKRLTNRSLNYHVPLSRDIPMEFNVKLKYNSKYEHGVLGSKTCSEMGICIAHGVLHALRACIMESRRDSGYDTNEWVDINLPYDTESILKALNVKTEEFLLTK